MRKILWVVMTFLALAVAAYAWVGITSPGSRGAFLADLFSEKALRTATHLGAGGIALIAGALQFNTGLRQGRPRVHRAIGRVYVIAVLIAGVAAALLAPVSSGGLTGHYGFGFLAVFWLASTLAAYVNARAGKYEVHRQWMIRSFALCLAAVTLRIYIPIFLISGATFDDAYPLIAWLCWVPNLVIAEWLIIPSAMAPIAPAN
jgi:uncharacterized membrane protein